MTDQNIPNSPGNSPEIGEVEKLLYEEAPSMTLKDNLGVAFALAALAVIGVLGYIWLTPDVSIATFFSPPQETPEAEVASEAGDTQTDEVEHQKCASCGMFADKSASHVVIGWNDGSTTHHDSWDCAFSQAASGQMEMSSVEISHYGSPVESPHFLDATQAWFLYDTEVRVEGSMPPFVAAFASKDEAESKQAEMAGEVVDYAGLAAKWDNASAPAPVDHSTMELDGHDMGSMDVKGAKEDEHAGYDAVATNDSSPATQNHDHEMNCEYCGMFADKSQSHVIAAWSNRDHTHHDCWDCAFYFGSENGLNLEAAEVTLLDSPLDNPVWINAEDAWYLYDMDKSVPGSMLPFIGAFASEESALAHQGEWGGEIVNFTNLSAKWQ